jgi:hypothetical protein
LFPLARCGRGVANPGDRGALALLELPQHQIVFERIGADRQIVAVWLEVEQDPGALIDAPRNSFEPHGDFAVTEIRHVLGHDVGEIGIGLDPVEELGVAVAIERARLVGDAGRGLSLLPLAAVDGEHLVVAFGLDPPHPHDAHERFWLAADGLVREVDFQRLRGASAQQQNAEGDASDRRDDAALDRVHG